MSAKHQLRTRLAQTAARIMAEEGIDDFRQATRKAAERMGIKCQPAQLPEKECVENALEEYYRLYQSHEHTSVLGQMRQIASEAMQFLAEFSPLLTGPVLEGYASRHSPITLHVYPETSEDVILKLAAAHIPHETSHHETRKGRGNSTMLLPRLTFIADGISIDLRMFPANECRGSHWQRNCGATLEEVRQLLDSPEDYAGAERKRRLSTS